MSSKLIAYLFISFSFLTNKFTFSQNFERSILDGKLASIGQFPYVVFLRNTPVNLDRGGWLCTGSILTELWVVTGAHCYSGYSKLNVTLADVRTYIKAGTIDRSDDTSTVQDRQSVEHVLMEPNKKKRFSTLFNNDIAIIKVGEPFVFNEEVGSITIAKSPLPKGGKLKCTLVGFGRTKMATDPKEGLRNTKLYYTDGTLEGDALSCQKRMRKMGREDADDWGVEHLCVDPSRHTSSPCNGDSGGPVVCDGLHVGTDVARMNMFGTKNTPCGAKGNFHVYMFLGYYENWLRKHIPDLPPSRPLEEAIHYRSIHSPRGGATRFREADVRTAVFIHLVFVVAFSNTQILA